MFGSRFKLDLHYDIFDWNRSFQFIGKLKIFLDKVQGLLTFNRFYIAAVFRLSITAANHQIYLKFELKYVTEIPNTVIYLGMCFCIIE